ncbi:MAG: hydrogenase small subunit [bacterium]|nr:hydrogenase small subunit [bacterium]
MPKEIIGQILWNRQVSRRDFLKFCSLAAGTMALPVSFIPRIVEALEKAKKPTVVWLEYQDCAGCSESLLRAAHPTIGEIVLDILSVDYHETIMAPAGKQSEKSFEDAIAEGGHIVIVEGSIPTANGGVPCTVSGKTALHLIQQATKKAAAVIAVGNCAAFGGIPAAAPNPTAARGVRDVISGVPVVNIPGCPMNVDNFTATIVHYLTFGGLPATDSLARPLFGFGKRIHDHCERRAHFDAGQYVGKWGDEGHRLGWCLYNMGCKGPETYHNCPDQRWNEGLSWPIGAGHGCVGCSEPNFWDTMTPFYRRLPEVPGFGVESTADKVGLALTGITAAGIGVHAIASALRGKAQAEPEETGKV